MLGSFMFRKDDIYKKTAVLSGGEKSRLNLVKFLVDPPNLLLMDEPTTHLDIHTVESLTLALERYEGTLVFISHDVHFIRHLATKVLHVNAGTVTPYRRRLRIFSGEDRHRRRRPRRAHGGVICKPNAGPLRNLNKRQRHADEMKNVAGSKRQQFRGFNHGFAIRYPQIVMVVKPGEDVETDVLAGIRNHARHLFQAVLVEQLHDFAKLFHAVGVHGIQAAQIHQRLKSGGHFRQQRHDIAAIAPEFGHRHMADVTHMQQSLRFVGRHQKHGADLGNRGLKTKPY